MTRGQLALFLGLLLAGVGSVLLSAGAEYAWDLIWWPAFFLELGMGLLLAAAGVLLARQFRSFTAQAVGQAATQAAENVLGLIPRAVRPRKATPPQEGWSKHMEEELHGIGAEATIWGKIEEKSGWVDNLFLFWWDTHEPDQAHDVKYRVEQEPVESKFGDVGRDEDSGKPGEVTLVGYHGFSPSKAAPVVECALVSSGLWSYVEKNFEEVRGLSPIVSAFGLKGERWWPARLTIHVLMETSDQWVIFALRDPEIVRWEGDMWSTSFEEGVTVVKTLRHGPEKTVHNTLLNGIEREFGLPLREKVGAAGGMETEVCGVGRAFSSTPRQHDSGELLGLGGVIVVVAHLNATLGDVWASLRTPSVDKIEHYGWLGCRFSNGDAVDDLLDATDSWSERGIGPAILRERFPGIEVDPFPESRGDQSERTGIWRREGFGWHSTSRARLELWSRMAFRY